MNTDTRKGATCPIRIVYAYDLAPGERDTVHLSQTRSAPGDLWSNKFDAPIAIIQATEHGDYAGEGVEASNYRVLLGDAAIAPHLIQLYGSHGYKALAYEAYLGPVPLVDELTEVLERLEESVLLDEDDHSALETELETEAWEAHGRRDFRKALTALLDEVDEVDDSDGTDLVADHEHEIPDDDEIAPAAVSELLDEHEIPDDDEIAPAAVSELLDEHPADGSWGCLLDGLWFWGCDELCVNGGNGFQVETGCTVYFHIDAWVRRYSDMIRPNPCQARLQACIAAIAKACRTGGE